MAQPAVPALARRLGTGDAVVIGLGSMIGAGVFAAFGPAAAVAGTGLLVGLLVAAVVAYANATSSAQLAAQYPTSGGTYAYGRERLGPWWGFVAGWGFVVGKTASCAAMTLTFAAYAVPGPPWLQRVVGLGGLAALTAVNYRGITRTARLTRVLVTISLVVLAFAVVVLVSGAAGRSPPAGWATTWPAGPGGWYAVLQAGGLLFFAFAGYARIATLGEEVRDPARTIPRAVPIALSLIVLLYAVVGVVLLRAAGPAVLAGSRTAVAGAVAAVGAAWAEPVVRIGAAVASLGSLLALIAGLGRTSLAMARGGDLPRTLAAVHPRHRVPHHAEIAVAVVVGLLVLTTDLRGVIGFSSFGVLTYYAVANAAAFTQRGEHRRWPRALQVLGVAGCALLVVTLPVTAVVAGVAVFAVGLAGRLVALRVRARRGPPTSDHEDSVSP